MGDRGSLYLAVAKRFFQRDACRLAISAFGMLGSAIAIGLSTAASPPELQPGGLGVPG